MYVDLLRLRPLVDVSLRLLKSSVFGDTPSGCFIEVLSTRCVVTIFEVTFVDQNFPYLTENLIFMFGKNLRIV